MCFLVYRALTISTEQKWSQSGKGDNGKEVHYSKKVNVQAVHVCYSSLRQSGQCSRVECSSCSSQYPNRTIIEYQRAGSPKSGRVCVGQIKPTNEGQAKHKVQNNRPESINRKRNPYDRQARHGPVVFIRGLSAQTEGRQWV